MTPRQILSTYYGIAGLHTLAASLVWGINTLFLLDAGLDIAQAFLVNATATAAIVVFEIPTGVVADARGRRTSLLLSAACLASSSLLYVTAGRLGSGGAGLATFHAGALLLGLGTTFYSGAAEAWLVDALDRAGHREPLEKVLARAEILAGTTTVAGTIAGGFLASLDLALPYFLRAALLAALFVLAGRGMKEPGFKPRLGVRLTEEIRGLARSSVAFGWHKPQARALLLVGFVQFVFLQWAFHAWQPYFLALLGRDAPWVAGIVGAVVTGATLIGNAIASRVGDDVRRSRRSLWTASALVAAAGVAVGLAGSFPLAVAALLVMSAAVGVVGPVKQAFLHRLTPSAQRASVISLDSLVRNAGAVGGQSGLGALARHQGVAAGYVVGGLVTVLALPWLRTTEESEA